MKKNKKEIYKELFRNIEKCRSFSQCTKNILSEKGGRLIFCRLEKFGYLYFSYNSPIKMPQLTNKGKELLNNLNDFQFQFKESEVFR